MVAGEEGEKTRQPGYITKGTDNREGASLPTGEPSQERKEPLSVCATVSSAVTNSSVFFFVSVKLQSNQLEAEVVSTSCFAFFRHPTG